MRAAIVVECFFMVEAAVRGEALGLDLNSCDAAAAERAWIRTNGPRGEEEGSPGVPLHHTLPLFLIPEVCVSGV